MFRPQNKFFYFEKKGFGIGRDGRTFQMSLSQVNALWCVPRVEQDLSQVPDAGQRTIAVAPFGTMRSSVL